MADLWRSVGESACGSGLNRDRSIFWLLLEIDRKRAGGGVSLQLVAVTAFQVRVVAIAAAQDLVNCG